MIVVGDDGLVAIFATDLDMLEPLWHDDLLLVRTFFDEDDLVVLHEGTAHFDGLSDITELGSAVARYEERIGVVVLVGGASCQHTCDSERE